ncbi:MAG: Rho termination factor N-terminal domain-containing protein, partial [Deltaproteobacteria bacterium]|nr:Rho termination factor N-terminal domain-containing protein [Deltaproteobacteria bacterium]
MDLSELKQLKIGDLNSLAKDLKIENSTSMRKQELIFALLQAQTELNGMIFG